MDSSSDCDEEFPDVARPDGRLREVKARRVEQLQAATLSELASELTSRIAEGGFPADDKTVLLGYHLQQALRLSLDVHSNRFARRRYLDCYGILHAHLRSPPKIEGATFVDLGCGGLNPGGLLMVFLALGAKRGVGVDLDSLHDLGLAMRALADVASMMLLDPGSIAFKQPIKPQQVLENLASFDFAKLRRGNAEGLDSSRLSFLNESVYEMSFPDGEADVVMSNAFLEHIPDVALGIREIGRITKSGGLSVHNIDMTDHRRYGGECGPIDFLREQSDEPIVHWSNRLRQSAFVELFESEGFVIEETRCANRLEVSAELRASLSEPFRSMSQEDLETGSATIVARKL